MTWQRRWADKASGPPQTFSFADLPGPLGASAAASQGASCGQASSSGDVAYQGEAGQPADPGGHARPSGGCKGQVGSGPCPASPRVAVPCWMVVVAGPDHPSAAAVVVDSLGAGAPGTPAENHRGTYVQGSNNASLPTK